MKNLRLSFISLFLAITLIGTAFAQNYEFKVMASKGNAVVQKDNSKSWDKLMLGTKVSDKDKIKLSGTCYLSLVHKSGKTIEIKKPGTYSISELSKQVGSKASAVGKRFADYLVDQMGGQDLLGEGNKDMGTTGSVERGMEDQPFMNKNKLKLNSPRKVNFISSVFTFRWMPFESTKDYVFVLSDRFDKQLVTKDVHGTTITINSDELKLERDTYYFWKVKAKGDDKNKSDDACFLVLSNNKAQAIRDTVDLIKKDSGDESNASSKIILAAFYEQNYIIDEALKSYKEAVTLAPDVDIYTKLYRRFLNRINVTEK